MRQHSGPGLPERLEELGQGVLVPALMSPHQPPGVVVDHARQIPVPLTIGDLVDPDPAEPVELIDLAGQVLHHPRHDPRDGPPGQPQEHRDRTQRHVLHQPRAGVLQQVRTPRARPRPRHIRHQHTVLRAPHPRRRRLQERPNGAGVHRPPPPYPHPRVIARAPPTALTTPTRRPGVGTHRHHQDLLVTVRIDLDRDVLDDHALDAQHLPEYPGLAHAVSLAVVRSHSKTKTTAGRGMSPQSRRSSTHYNVTRAIFRTADQPTSAGLELALLCLLYTSPSPRDGLLSRMPSSA